MALRSPFLLACCTGGMREETAGLSPGPGQLPPLAFTGHFPLGCRSRELGPLNCVRWADGGCLGARRNLITLVKLTLTATVPLKCWLIPPFQSSSLSLSGWGSRCFCPADIYTSCLFDIAPSFSFREPPTCQWFRGRNGPSLANQSTDLPWPL